LNTLTVLLNTTKTPPLFPMSATATLQQLRAQLNEKFPLAQRSALALSSPTHKTTPHTPKHHTDQPSPAPQLPPGKVIEITPANAAASTSTVLHQLIKNSSNRYTALIDSSDSFEPAAAAPASLTHLLWLRCQHLQQALQAADLLLRDGNLSTILLDLRLQPLITLKKLPNSTWHRLRLLSAHHGLALAIFTPAPLIPCHAQRWRIEPDPHQHLAA
jgi:hypothetical protein